MKKSVVYVNLIGIAILGVLLFVFGSSVAKGFNTGWP
jgi:hypothetical protein